MFYRVFMGSRRTASEKAQSRPASRHAWIYPTAMSGPLQGVIVSWARRGDEDWVRVAYVSGDSPPTLIDTWLPARLCPVVNGPVIEPNY